MILLKGITKRYGALTVYENFDFSIEDGTVTCILGESGSGKTTLLNMLAGLTPYQGEITPRVKCSYVFQEPRLVPSLTVLGNLGLICRDVDRIRTMLAAVGLEGREGAYPRELSGGQAQRVSLARAFLYPSKVILMDEPFSSLDIALKVKMAALFLGFCIAAVAGAVAGSGAGSAELPFLAALGGGRVMRLLFSAVCACAILTCLFSAYYPLHRAVGGAPRPGLLRAGICAAAFLLSAAGLGGLVRFVYPLVGVAGVLFFLALALSALRRSGSRPRAQSAPVFRPERPGQLLFDEDPFRQRDGGIHACRQNAEDDGRRHHEI